MAARLHLSYSSLSRSILSYHCLAIAATDAQWSCICSARNIVVIGATVLAVEEEKVSLQKWSCNRENGEKKAFCHDEVRRVWRSFGQNREMVEAYFLLGELFLLFSSLVERESKSSFFFYFFIFFFLLFSF